MAVTPTTSITRASGGRGRARLLRRGRYGEHPLLPYLFVLPHLIFFMTFIGFATVLGFWISLHKFDFLQPVHPFIGLRNYVHLLLTPGDLYHDYFFSALGNTFIFVLMTVPALVILGLLLANLLNTRFRGRDFFRAVYLAPWALSAAVVATLWRFIFQDPNEGVANLTLKALHLPQIGWFADTWWAWTAISICTIWWTVGFNIVVLLAGLQNISESLYEAAQMDGAGAVARFFHITLPGLRPVLLFVTINQLIASFNVFAQPQIMTGGGPGDSTYSVVMRIWDTGFPQDKMGMAAAMSFVFGVLLVVFSIISFRFFSSERA